MKIMTVMQLVTVGGLRTATFFCVVVRLRQKESRIRLRSQKQLDQSSSEEFGMIPGTTGTRNTLRGSMAAIFLLRDVSIVEHCFLQNKQLQGRNPG